MWTLLFCNVDENGNIINSLIGDKVVPVEQYDYFFFLPGEDPEIVINNITDYHVVDGKLVNS